MLILTIALTWLLLAFVFGSLIGRYLKHQWCEYAADDGRTMCALPRGHTGLHDGG